MLGMEACGSAHHWARVIRGHGHEVKLMPPAYVKPYGRVTASQIASASRPSFLLRLFRITPE
jgi:transposase